MVGFVQVRPLQHELRKNAGNISVACIGVKGRNGLATSFRDAIMLHVSEFGKNPVTFMEAAYVADQIFNGPVEERREHDVVRLQFNHYLNMVQSRPTDSKYPSKVQPSKRSRFVLMILFPPPLHSPRLLVRLICWPSTSLKEDSRTRK
jgi:F0F1-type ATP synthase gamma subunit